MKKRFLSLVLALLLIISSLPLALAADRSSNDVVSCGYYFTEDARFFFLEGEPKPSPLNKDNINTSMERFGSGKAQKKLLTVTAQVSRVSSVEQAVIAAGSLRCSNGSTNKAITVDRPVKHDCDFLLQRNNLPPVGEGNDPFLSVDDDFRLIGRTPLPLQVFLDGKLLEEIPGDTQIDLPVNASVGLHRVTVTFGDYTLLNESFAVLPKGAKYALEWFRLGNAGMFMLLPMAVLSGVAALMNPLVGLAMAPAWAQSLFSYANMIFETALQGKNLLK